MAMRKSTRRELAKARELLDYFLDGATCWFCHKPLREDACPELHGTGRGTPLVEKITIHHLAYGAADWRTAAGKAVPKKFKRLAHKSCHNRHEARSRRRRGGKFVQNRQSDLRPRVAA